MGAKGGHRRSGARAALALVALVLAVPAFALPAGASSELDALLSLLNGARAEANQMPLRHADDLAAVAAAHSGDMARSGTLRHNSALRRQVDPGLAIAENIAYSSSVAGLHGVLMQSPEHRESILSPDYDEVGIGLAGSGSRLWVTQVFRRSRAGVGPDQTARSTPEPAPVPPPPVAPAPAPPPPPPVTTTSVTTTTVAVQSAPPGTGSGPQDAPSTSSTVPSDGQQAAPAAPPSSLPPDGFTAVPADDSTATSTPSPDTPLPSTTVPDGFTSPSTTVAPPPSPVSVLASLLGLTPASHSREAEEEGTVRLEEVAATALVLVVLALAFSPLRAVDPGSSDGERSTARRGP